MPDYGIHTCLRLDRDIKIYKWAGTWTMTIVVEVEEEIDEEINFEVGYCPACGEELK